ncbi:MAG: SAM-dependent methyltransferase [Betaproteobacteria bacterium]|nr:SAM-dependent methyltransferase [Betaproteobacteria bacterium]
MSLIFQRLARNFIKNGYFPTDEVTLGRILNALSCGKQPIRICDPCCGEGVALAEVQQHLGQLGADVIAYGVEYDHERAWHAKELLNVVTHADIHDVQITPRSMGLLFLNPPYGDVVSDKAGTGDRSKRDRLEKVFMRRTLSLLQWGGVLVLIVPHYVLDEEFAALLARNFDHVKAFMAPETRFKQAVVMGCKVRSGQPNAEALVEIKRAFDGQALVFPDEWIEAPYQVPAMNSADSFAFQTLKIDVDQFAAELERFQKEMLWPQFNFHFSHGNKVPRRPLRDLSRWHLALALAAGQISGLVTSADGQRRLLIKGNTFKGKNKSVERTIDDDGNVTETITLTDKFVPVIRAIDFSPGPHYGAVVTIQ